MTVFSAPRSSKDFSLGSAPTSMTLNTWALYLAPHLGQLIWMGNVGIIQTPIQSQQAHFLRKLL